MKPYFQTHSAGWLFLLGVIAFFGMEVVQFFRQRGWRKDATRIATPAFWVGVAVWTVVATVMLHRGSRIAPGASIGNGPEVFAVGMALLVAGAALRWSSFWALAQYFTFTVDVSFDQSVVQAGPYRLLRHPGYAGGLLAMAGIAVVYANWVGLAGFVVPCLIIIIWRIRIEEAALLHTTGDQYRAYAAHHKRLVPLVW
ncbi:MAG: methyltransferase family protein [Solirubrobacteraceae bacterium]